MENWTPDSLKAKLDSQKPIFVKLWKKGCGACKLSKPAIERLEAKYAQVLEFGQIDAGEYPEMLEIAETEVLPTFFLFNKARLLDKSIGFKGLKKLDDFISDVIEIPKT